MDWRRAACAHVANRRVNSRQRSWTAFRAAARILLWPTPRLSPAGRKRSVAETVAWTTEQQVSAASPISCLGLAGPRGRLYLKWSRYSERPSPTPLTAFVEHGAWSKNSSDAMPFFLLLAYLGLGTAYGTSLLPTLPARLA